MITSPDSNRPARVVMVELVASPAGTITQATRGAVELGGHLLEGGRRLGPEGRPPPSGPGSERSKATTSCPCSMRRWVMLAPILPRPTMAIFMVLSSVSCGGGVCRDAGRRGRGLGAGCRGSAEPGGRQLGGPASVPGPAG